MRSVQGETGYGFNERQADRDSVLISIDGADKSTSDDGYRYVEYLSESLTGCSLQP